MSFARHLLRLSVGTVVGVVLITPAAADAAPKQVNVTLWLGYFPNVTHATAIAGVESDALLNFA